MPTFTNKVPDDSNGIEGESVGGRGVTGKSTLDYGMRAHSTESAGLRGSSDNGRGVEGWATTSEGVVGISKQGTGVWGQTEGAGSGVLGTSRDGAGIAGRSDNSVGARGDSTNGRGMEGRSTTSDGVYGHGKVGGHFEGSFEGVHAVSHDPRAAGVAGYNDSTGPGVFGKSRGGAAGYFDGDVVITGVIHLAAADYAEDFTVSDPGGVEPGTVMVMDDVGGVLACRVPYDRRVAGVISGAGDYRPAVILDHCSTRPNRQPLALMGKVFCKVDATLAPVCVGDLLTTSSVPGHAMKASDQLQAFGAVIGKALQPLASGSGLIPILVRLQ